MSVLDSKLHNKGVMCMIRDFSRDKFDEMKKQINDISDKQFSGFTDFLGDLVYGGGKLTGLIDIDDDMSNVKSYHNYVLDQNDTTIRDLENILTNVRGVDFVYRSKLSNIQILMQDYSEFLRKATEMINTRNNNFVADNIYYNMSAIQSRIVQNEKVISQIYDENLTVAEQRIAKEATRGLIKGVLSIAGTIYTFPATLIKEGPGALVTETWDIINSVFEVGNDLTALGMVGTGRFMSNWLGDDARIYAIKEAEKATERETLKDELEAASWNGLAKAVGYVDVGVDGLDIIIGAESFVKDSIEDLGDLKKIFTGKSSWSERGKNALDFMLGKAGFESLELDEADNLNEAKKWINKSKQKGNWFKNAKQIYDYHIAYDDGKIMEELVADINIAKYVKDVKSGMDDIGEIISTWDIKFEDNADFEYVPRFEIPMDSQKWIRLDVGAET